MLILGCSTAALCTGFILDALWGDPPSLPHLVRWMGSLITRLEKFLRKILPATAKGERLGGVFLVLGITVFWAGLPFAVLFLSYYFSPLLGYITESLLCYQLLAAKSLYTEGLKVYSNLKDNNVEAARKQVAMIVGRDTALLDKDGINRAAIETIAENASDGVAAPLFFIMLGGAALGCAYKAVNTMDSMVGYQNNKYLHFGFAAAKTDDILNFIPSRLCSLIMIAGACLLRLDGKNAYNIWRRDRRKHASPNSAQTESVCAGALGIRLAGPAAYGGVICRKPYIGDDARPVRSEDIIKANRLMYMAAVLMLILALLFRAVLWGVIFYGKI